MVVCTASSAGLPPLQQGWGHRGEFYRTPPRKPPSLTGGSRSCSPVLVDQWGPRLMTSAVTWTSACLLSFPLSPLHPSVFETKPLSELLSSGILLGRPASELSGCPFPPPQQGGCKHTPPCLVFSPVDTTHQSQVPMLADKHFVNRAVSLSPGLGNLKARRNIRKVNPE